MKVLTIDEIKAKIDKILEKRGLKVIYDYVNKNAEIVDIEQNSTEQNLDVPPRQ